MGIIIPFRAQDGRKAARRRMPHAGSAEILLFTGVRYERYGTDPARVPAARQPRRRA